MRHQQNPRSLLHAATGLALGGTALAQAAAPDAKAYVLTSADGETVVRPSGDIVTKVDPTRGAPNVAMGTHHLRIGAGIPVHRHELMDEILLAQESRGAVMLTREQSRAIGQKHGTIFKA